MRTKVHGLKFIFSPDKTKLQRVTWIMAFFLCIALLLTWSRNRVLYLMSYPAVTKIYMVWAHNMSFPAVTFCNKNVFRASGLTREDLYHSGYWIDLMYANHTVMERSLAILKESHKQGLVSLLDFNNYTQPAGYRVNTTEMMGRLGHQLDDMLLQCWFRGDTCTSRNFSTVCMKR
ncbi:acid-sensing ion channel 1-like [Nerophis ophidion]|uniref:acid-sensing ion channel 1-like n=1 Tax=Nerophis ophidion TaxID=159077 RepID=UPI002ADF03F5|nr:acid-sensing ion channel 1-like [Nerophis ophidion]